MNFSLYFRQNIHVIIATLIIRSENSSQKVPISPIDRHARQLVVKCLLSQLNDRKISKLFADYIHFFFKFVANCWLIEKKCNCKMRQLTSNYRQLGDKKEQNR